MYVLIETEPSLFIFCRVGTEDSPVEGFQRYRVLEIEAFNKRYYLPVNISRYGLCTFESDVSEDFFVPFQKYVIWLRKYA